MALKFGLLALDHNVAKIDADAKLHAALGRETRVLHLNGALDLDRTLDGIDDAGKLSENAVAGAIDEPPVMLLDEGVKIFCDER
jgi:hypothetical protein